MIREDIELLFKNARTEGALRKWADGQRDAEEVISLIVDKLASTAMRVRLKGAIDNYSGIYHVGISEYDQWQITDRVMKHTIKEIKE